MFVLIQTFEIQKLKMRMKVSFIYLQIDHKRLFLNIFLKSFLIAMGHVLSSQNRYGQVIIYGWTHNSSDVLHAYIMLMSFWVSKMVFTRGLKHAAREFYKVDKYFLCAYLGQN